MAATFIYKPETYKGPVVLVPSEGSRNAPTIKTPDGKTFTGKYLNTNEGRHQFVFPRDLYGYEGLQLSYEGQNTTLGSGKVSYESSSIGGMADSPRAKGSLGSGGGAYGASMVGQYGVVPANILAEFPEAELAKYKGVKQPKYNFTDPFQFAERYSEYGRGEYAKNFEQAQGMGLESLRTELKGLQEFAPAAAALKRNETALDNQFNQEQRTKQIEGALPGFIAGVNQDLEGQRGRAGAYAEGRIPDAVADRAFELGIRSSAADRAAAGGFGARSSVARKASDLMSAEQRVKLSQYGDELLTSNVTSRGKFADWQLAPTEYSDAGGQIKVMPSKSAGDYAQESAKFLSTQYGLSAGQALATEVQQNQFTSTQKQQVDAFNATNKFQESMFNAGVMNNFALTKFGYKAGYANSMAAGLQTDVNTSFGLDQQQRSEEILKQYMSKSQDAGMLSSIFSGGMSLLPAIMSGGTSLLNKDGGGGTGLKDAAEAAAKGAEGVFKTGGGALKDVAESVTDLGK